MSNKYRTNLPQLANKVYQNIGSYLILEDDNPAKRKAKSKALILFLINEMKEEIENFGIISIKKFGSFSIKRRKRGGKYVKFTQAKRLKEFIAETVKPLDIGKDELMNRQIDSILNLDRTLTHMNIKGIFETDLAEIVAKHKSPDKKIKVLIQDFILEFFLTIERLVIKFKVVDIEGFGSFFLGHNNLYGLHFKYSPQKSEDIFNEEVLLHKKDDLWA